MRALRLRHRVTGVVAELPLLFFAVALGLGLIFWLAIGSGRHAAAAEGEPPLPERSEAKPANGRR